METNYGQSMKGMSEVSIVDMLLLGQEFNLEDDGTDDLMVCVTMNMAYKNAVKARKDWLSKLKNLPICVEMKRTWQQMAGDDNTEEEITNQNQAARSGKKKRERKKRKLMKGLKKYTGPADDGERKFKGWSDSGHKAFEQWTMSIKADVRKGMYTCWEKAFRAVQAKLQEKKRERQIRYGSMR